MIFSLFKLSNTVPLRRGFRNIGKLPVSVVSDWALKKLDPISVLHMLFERPATRFFLGKKKHCTFKPI